MLESSSMGNIEVKRGLIEGHKVLKEFVKNKLFLLAAGSITRGSRFKMIPNETQGEFFLMRVFLCMVRI